MGLFSKNHPRHAQYTWQRPVTYHIRAALSSSSGPHAVCAPFPHFRTLAYPQRFQLPNPDMLTQSLLLPSNTLLERIRPTCNDSASVFRGSTKPDFQLRYHLRFPTWVSLASLPPISINLDANNLHPPAPVLFRFVFRVKATWPLEHLQCLPAPRAAKAKTKLHATTAVKNADMRSDPPLFLPPPAPPHRMIRIRDSIGLLGSLPCIFPILPRALAAVELQ